MEGLMEKLQGLEEAWLPLVLEYGSQFLLALLTLAVGWWIVGRLVAALNTLMQKRNVEPTLHGFVSSLASIALKVLLLVSVAGMVGIETTSFIAVLGAAGLAVGLALQGSLANFAGGALILFLRPFRAGDYIEAQGVGGTVDSIQIFNTILKTPDNKTVIVPNGSLSNGNIVNYSRQATRRVDVNIGIDYGDDVKQARSILLGLAAADSRVLKDPEAVVWLVSLGDNSVNLSLRMWTKTEDFWGVFWDIQEQAKEAFDAQGITIPFPQRTVHVVKQEAE
ncbi:mechanosensitive ion channel family protein [Pseudomonas neustonica]|uniref:Small-conductance mechanosensitive channel n=1 Tax=Pseudomonas neustonica TaxID=2487346 RepID=A0ABX9XKS9_9PSED|nr:MULTISPECIES: mechanosensitive ion channel domain-containing protein [Pseudomonas]MAB25244.1 mechanosensitive ion channel protein MscS [Pseudomonadales bacterium]MBA6418516.1 mechanosensitive ion channel [Pseudomonas sp. 5Ae-yellow]ROZ84966.1 mechanosensitive ion channel family protein [Pseudomonas sp. SSM44]ROZ86747.1 mechanosensitive ion channel family protein [Pseudomonas neustonica]